MKEFKNSNGDTVRLHNEQETRTKYEVMARTIGCLPEYYQLINKYDGFLRNCTNQQERQAIAAMGILELNNLFNGYNSVGFGGKLTINGEIAVEQKLDTEEKK